MHCSLFSILGQLKDRQKKQAAFLDEWKEKSSRFAKSLDKSADKLETGTAAEREVSCPPVGLML